MVEDKYFMWEIECLRLEYSLRKNMTLTRESSRDG